MEATKNEIMEYLWGDTTIKKWHILYIPKGDRNHKKIYRLQNATRIFVYMPKYIYMKKHKMLKDNVKKLEKK